MALSVSSYGQPCVPPTNFVSLAYNSSSPNNINSSTVFSTYSTNGLAINQNPLTIPTQCNSGMDIVFLVDYTGSMTSAINGVKAGIANILSTINTESLGNYRVGLCIFDEYLGNLTSPPTYKYGQTSTYVNLPASQKAVINTFNNRTQFITCMQPLGNVGSITDFQTKLNLLATPSFPLGDGQFTPEPGELGVNEILSNNIAGSFRSDAIKLIILITDAIPGGNDDTNNSIDQTYINGTLIDLCNSYDVQIMTQSSLAAATSGNYYYNLSTGTTVPGRYDQVTFDSAGNWINTGLVSGIQNLCNNSYIATCETAPSGWYYEAGSAYAVYYDSELGYVTDEYWFPPTYSISANKTIVDEENVKITFVVDTQYLNASPTTLWWELNPYNANASDLIEAINDGYVIITTTSGVNGQGVFELTTKPDYLTEGAEWLVVKLTDASSNVLDTVNVRILDSSLDLPTATPIPPTATPVPCYTYTFQLTDRGNSGQIIYTMCDGRSDTVYLPPYAQPIVLCVKAIGSYNNVIITQVGSQCYSSSGAGAGYPTATPIPPTATAIPPTPTATRVPDPTATAIPPTATAVPVPTATSAPSGTCYHVWAADTVDVYRYGLSYNFGGNIERTFNQMLASPYYYNGRAGAVYSICSTFSPSVWDSSEMVLIVSDDIFVIDETGGCTSEFGCSYSEFIPNPTATPNKPEPTTDPGYNSWLAERNDGGAYAYVGPFSGLYSFNQSVYVDDASGLCWTLGSPAITVPEFNIFEICEGGFTPFPTATPDRSSGGGCLLKGTLVKLSNGTEVTIESLTTGMELSSIIIGNMPDESNVEALMQWSQTNPTLSNTSATVTQNTEYIVNSILSFNDGLLVSSEDHIHVVKRNSVWCVMKASDILVGDSFVNQNGSEQVINSIVKSNGVFEVYKLDVESNDVYIANGTITHNYKEPIIDDPRP